MQRQWRIIPHDADRVEQLMRTARLPAVVAQLLVSRGVYNAEDAARFLDTKLMGLRDPASSCRGPAGDRDPGRGDRRQDADCRSTAIMTVTA